MRDYSTIADEYHSGFGKLAKDIPGPITGFQELMTAATKNGALSTKTKELIAFAIGTAVRCDGCLAHHSQAILKAGATREEVAEMIGVTLLMGGGPSSVYRVEAVRASDEFANKMAAAAE